MDVFYPHDAAGDARLMNFSATMVLKLFQGAAAGREWRDALA